MSYNIEQKLASKNGWFTPAEARNYYGRYDRHGITWHWWGGGESANAHDNIVNYLNSNAANGISSVNYVVSDAKITLSVGPDNVAWTSQSGNPVTVSVELQPTLGAEGYKKAGWLAAEIAARYGGDRSYYPHKYWNQTACPGTISLDRIRQEEDKWQRGEYNSAPAPTPTWNFVPKVGKAIVTGTGGDGLWILKEPRLAAQTVTVVNEGTPMDFVGYVTNGDDVEGNRVWWKNVYGNYFSARYAPEYIVPAPAPTPAPTPPAPAKPLPTPVIHVVKYTLSNAKLVNIEDMSVVKTFAIDTPMDISGEVTWNGNKFWLTQSAMNDGRLQGFLVGDLKDSKEQPNPEPTPAPIPTPPTPEDPEYVKNLRDIDDTQYWLKEEFDIVDITTGKPVTGQFAKHFAKDEPFVSSAVTSYRGTEYRITDYSYKAKRFNGVPIDKLTLTPPGVPDIDPVPHNPDFINKNVVIAFLDSIVKLITEFIQKLKG